MVYIENIKRIPPPRESEPAGTKAEVNLKVPSAENTVLSKVLQRHNTAFYASLTARDSKILMFCRLLGLLSIRFFLLLANPFKYKVLCREPKIKLLLVV